mmetsp:Transcript_15966/g.20999  ORF Transcript_15966/g.20999 Transcript_15966/m.20999 type:complete len:618 (-) Transcript_15966:400-2253(-)
MRILPSACVLLVALAAMSDNAFMAEAKRSSGRSSAPSRRGPSGSSRSSGGGRRSAPVSRRRHVYDEEEEEEEEQDFGFPDSEVDDEPEEDMYDDEEEEEVLRPVVKSKRRSTAATSGRRGGAPSSRKPKPAPQKRTRSTRSRYEEESEEDDYDDYERPSRGGRRPSSSSRGGPPPGRYNQQTSNRRGGRGPPRGRQGGAVVSYSPQPAGAFTRGLAALRESIPDPASVKEAAGKTFGGVRDTTSKLSANIYREVKGLTSSELEQVMLKATRPDDTPVKSKHVERLVGVTYQISGRYDIYDAVLRKLWKKMTEKDWRVKLKALYILHRFSADGAPEHAPALKARLRELRRTRDPKRKEKYFNSKQLLAGNSTPENLKFRAFMARYAHYVLLRAQCFGGVFDEIALEPPTPKAAKGKPKKPITSTSLRPEHLEAATMILKAGVACSLKDGEECENTAIPLERAASDLIALTTAVATALNRALKSDDADPSIVKKWCEFYSEELLPQTKSMVKKTAAKLDAYGLFLPSRMGATVSQELLQKGLKGGEGAEKKEEDVEEPSEPQEDVDEEPEAEESGAEEEEELPEEEEEVEEEEPQEEEELDEYDEYDYDEEEYYDDEEA